MEKYDCAVSIVTFGAEKSEIDSIIAQLRCSKRRCKIAIFNNHPTICYDLEESRDLIYFNSPTNIGFGKGHNAAVGLLERCSDYVLIMNSDIHFEGDVIDLVISRMEEDRKIGLLMPKVLNPDGSVQTLCRLLPNPFTVFIRGFFKTSCIANKVNEKYEFHNWEYNTERYFPFLSGCFMMVRRNVYDKLDGFDPRFFVYAEDMDFSRRIADIARCLFFPGATIIHNYRSRNSSNRLPPAFKIHSFIRYFNKWGWIFDTNRRKLNKDCLGQFYLGDRL